MCLLWWWCNVDTSDPLSVTRPQLSTTNTTTQIFPKISACFLVLFVLVGSLWFLGSFLVPVGSILWDIFKVVGSASFKRQMTPFILYLVTLSRLLMRCDINC